MAKKQLRIKSNEIDVNPARWLAQSVSVVLKTGIVHEVVAHTLANGVLYCSDSLRLKHSFLLTDIYEIILYFPVAEHAQTSAN